MIQKVLCLFVCAFIMLDSVHCLIAQEITQILKGKVLDSETELPLPFATIVVKGTEPLKGATSDAKGNFIIDNLPLGRYDILTSYMGYEAAIHPNLVVSSGKEVILTIYLKEALTKLDEIVVKPDIIKEKPLNSMSSVSARQLNVEEAGRYAGGFNDPARLVSSYAGVASSISNNGIVVRGNAPQYLLWRLEDVEIPNPNHFADLNSFGAGGLTALSCQLLANSDFFTGAFPAEYGNVLSGVFDIKMRSGNCDKREYTFQTGIIGIDFASEGPFRKGKASTYLFNYRYSTLGLISPLLPEDAEGTNYQDLSFKLDFPTKKAGKFSVWGLGAIDRSGQDAEKDPLNWEYNQDREENNSKQFMGTLGMKHKLNLNRKSRIQSNLSLSCNGIELETERTDANLSLNPYEFVKSNTWKLSFGSYIHNKFNVKHTNRTGFIASQLHYDLKLKELQNGTFSSLVDENSSSCLFQFYSQSKLNLSSKLILNAGIHTQYFALNNNYSIEPRLGINWNFRDGNSLSFGYGLHSRLDRMPIYFAQISSHEGEAIRPNKNLEFTKSHHFVLGYDRVFGKYHRLKIETYYQHLFDVPVEKNSSFSLLNLEDDWFIDRALTNDGTGENFGVDITFEQFMKNGFYYLVTASLYDSKYKGGDKIERSTRYDKSFVCNLLGGKEWSVGKLNQNTMSLNGKFSYQKGDKISPVDLDATIGTEEVIYNEALAFSKQEPDLLQLSFTINYRKNKAKHASTWSFQIINALGAKEFYGYKYNLITQGVEKDEELIVIPNISYKIDF